ncbi:hypothetical protein TNCV_1642111 [Trichonephila clavipes]|nr:hypothetical protein TNCV_1642111 [Trichonephila clavipes]
MLAIIGVFPKRGCCFLFKENVTDPRAGRLEGETVPYLRNLVELCIEYEEQRINLIENRLIERGLLLMSPSQQLRQYAARSIFPLLRYLTRWMTASEAPYTPETLHHGGPKPTLPYGFGVLCKIRLVPKPDFAGG